MTMSDKSIDLNFKLHPKQLEALSSPATEILFGGATRGGKSHFTRVALILWCTWVPGLQCLVLRKYYDDVIKNHMEGPNSFRSMLQPYVDAKLVVITKDAIRWTQTGSLITLSHCSTEDAMEKNQGIPKDVLVFEEACQILERHIRFVRGWVTSTEEMKAKLPPELKGMFPKIIYTANPIGVSMGYFRRNFVKAAPPGTIFKAPVKDGGFLRQYIPARVDDNPSESKEATFARIQGLDDENMADALLEGNWDAPIGDYFPQYDDVKHTTPNFLPPKHWFKFMTFDWGSSEPFAALWWGVSDGVEFLDEIGKKRWFPRGALVAYREWYGCKPENFAKGLQLRNPEIARGIVDRTLEETCGLVVTDSLPFQDRGMSRNGKKYNISDVFAENGCPLVQGNCARITGWTQVRDRLIGKDGAPLIYFSEDCVFTRDYLPSLGHSKTNPEDAAEDGEATHTSDAVRLACTTRPIVIDAKREDMPYKFKSRQTMCPAQILKQLKRQDSQHGRY
ncbi:MAG: hypothetical protein DRI61_03450 [Chloroflexi bacterium]|nr:MAG: hypothetical protein DRI61_03450 [Chloroflexota bacterium]